MEGPLAEFTPLWVGEEVSLVMTRAGKLFADLGGYPLPKKAP